MINQAKTLIRDMLSIIRQALGLPHNRTTAQVKHLKQGLSEYAVSEDQLRLIAQAYDLSMGQIFNYMAEVRPEHTEHDQARWHERSSDMMSLRDRKVLHILVRSHPIECCVETGTAGGASACIILQQLQRQGRGRLMSIDLTGPNSTYLGELIPDELKGYWELRLQSSTPILPGVLAEFGPIDMFLHDSNHNFRHMMWEYELAWKNLKLGGLLVSHDVLCTTAFEDFQKKYQHEIKTARVVGNIGFAIKGETR